MIFSRFSKVFLEFFIFLVLGGNPLLSPSPTQGWHPSEWLSLTHLSSIVQFFRFCLFPHAISDFLIFPLYQKYPMYNLCFELGRFPAILRGNNEHPAVHWGRAPFLDVGLHRCFQLVLSICRSHYYFNGVKVMYSFQKKSFPTDFQGYFRGHTLSVTAI